MGWQDAPVVGESQKWASAPAVDDLHDSSEYEAPKRKETTVDRIKKLAKETLEDRVPPIHMLGEAALSQAGNLVGSALGGLGAIGGSAVDAMTGVPSEGAVDRAAERVRGMQERFSYTPSSAGGKLINEVVGAPFEAAGGFAGEALGAAGGLVGPKTRAAGEEIGKALPYVAPLVKGLKSMSDGQRTPEGKAGEASAKEAYHRKLAESATDVKDSVQSIYAKAQKTENGIEGFAMPPMGANPKTAVNVGQVIAGDTQMSKALSEQNYPRVQEHLTKEVGLPNRRLKAEDFSAVQKDLNKHYDAAARAIPGEVILDAPFLEELNGLKEGTAELAQKYPGIFKTSDKLSAMIESLQQKHSAQDVLELSKQLRKDAKKYARGQDKEHVDLAIATGKAAASLDEMLGRALETDNPELFKAYTEARTKKAQVHALEEAWNPDTGVIDGRVLGALKKGGAYLTGALDKVGSAASVAPNAFIPPELLTGASIGGVGHMSMGMARMLGHADPTVTGIALLGGPLARFMTTPDFQKGTGSAAKALGGRMEAEGKMPPAVPPEIQGPPRGTPDPISMQQAEPQRPLPTLEGAPPILPPSGQATSAHPLFLGNELAPAIERTAPGAPLPLGGPSLPPVTPRAEPGAPVFPAASHPQEFNARPTLELGQPGSAIPRDKLPATQALRTRHDVPTVEFPLRQEVLQQPEIVKAVEAFRSEAQDLQDIIRKAPNPGARERARVRLQTLQKEFEAGMARLGARNAEEAHGLRTPLYEGGGQTRLPIQKTFSMKDAPNE